MNLNQNHAEQRERRLAMTLSVAVAFLMLCGKIWAYWVTGSVAILSDAAESVIHAGAVGFAAFSLWLSARPARAAWPYGFERITFFSAGFEGGMIVVAALWIIVAAIQKWRQGLTIEDLGFGTLLVAVFSGVNLLLGLYLVHEGKRTASLILEANGRHVLTDSVTSFGVVGGLLLVLFTGWKPFDPILGILVAVNIIRTGFNLMWTAVKGLLDLPDPGEVARLRLAVEGIARESGIGFHRLRYRDTGQRWIVSVHLQMPGTLSLADAHVAATQFEKRLVGALEKPVEVLTHIESAEDHGTMHPDEPAEW